MLSEDALRAMQVEIAVLRDEVEELRGVRERYEKALDRIAKADSFWAARRIVASTEIAEKKARVLAFRKRMLMGGDHAEEGAT